MKTLMEQVGRRYSLAKLVEPLMDFGGWGDGSCLSLSDAERLMRRDSKYNSSFVRDCYRVREFEKVDAPVPCIKVHDRYYNPGGELTRTVKTGSIFAKAFDVDKIRATTFSFGLSSDDLTTLCFVHLSSEVERLEKELGFK